MKLVILFVTLALGILMSQAHPISDAITLLERHELLATGDLACYKDLFSTGLSFNGVKICFFEHLWRHNGAKWDAWISARCQEAFDYFNYKIEQVAQPFPYVANDFYTVTITFVKAVYLSISGLKGTQYESEVTN